jgi:outer membrane receptor protein involved in Fe transport
MYAPLTTKQGKSIMKTTSYRQHKLAIAVATTLGISLPLTAPAQTVLEEVIVTAQKREQSLQDVPVAVSAFTGDMLQQSGVKDMFDLQTNAPSLIVSQTQTSTTTTFSIRGVFTSSQNFGLEPSVGLYVDGVYRARQGSMINNMVDVASVEVLRGPQGTLFGRNTPAGAIQINSVAPDFDGTGFIEGTAGDYDLWGVSGAKSFTLIDDVLAVRATGFVMNRDGYVDLVNQEKTEDDAIHDRDRWGVRFQALYTPNDDLTIRFNSDYSEVNEVCCAVGSWKNNFVPQDIDYPPGEPPYEGTDRNLVELGGTVIDQRDFYDYKSTANRAPESDNEDRGVSLQVDWQTDNFLVTSITAYREHESYDDADITFTDLDGAYRTNDADQDQFTQELRLSDEGTKLSYVVGLYYYRQNLDNDRTTIVGDDLTAMLGLTGLSNAVGANAFVGGTGAFDTNEQEHTSYAIFGQTDYNLTDSLVLTTGLRWTYEEKDMSNVFTDDAPPTAPLPFLDNWGFYNFAPLTPQDNIDTDFDDDQVTGTLKLSWFMNNEIMLYASYGTGYKSGGLNTDRIPSTVAVQFDAEESESIEVGMKAEFPDQALRLNVALHMTDTDDLQTSSFQGGGFELINAGTAETYGGEIDLSWLPTDSTTLTLAYAYNHGEYEDFEDGPCWVSTPWHRGFGNDPLSPEDPAADERGFCDQSGGDMSGNPENVVVITGNQDFRLTDGLTGFLYGEYIFTDERMTDVNNDPVKYDDSYSMVNLRAGVIFEDWNAQLTVWGRNVTDEDSTNTVSDAPAQYGRSIAYFNEPATWGVTLRKDF